MLSRQQILAKTLYGTDIYAFFLRQHYQGETVMHIKGRECGNCRNPFNDGSLTLHIWREKLHPERRLSDEMSYHHDLSGTIPDGDCFDFAQFCTGLKDQELLEYINREMYLHIGDDFNQYTKTEPVQIQEQPEDIPETIQESPILQPQTILQPEFSFYAKPITNKIPQKTVTLLDTYNYLISDRAKWATDQLRALAGTADAKPFKLNNFDYITPAGTFSRCEAKNIIKPSGLMVIDIDKLESPGEVEDTAQLLLTNQRLETELLFRSPSGNGIKWIIPVVNNNGHDHEYYFRAVFNYLKSFGITVDKSGKDVSRACFLPHDPNAFINPKYR